jgi:hypothetical protein
VPTAAFKSGVFTVPTATGTQTVNLTAGAADNLTGLGPDPEIQRVLNLLPNPNGGDVIPGVSGILNFGSPDALNDYNWTAKIDHKLTEKHQLSLRYAGTFRTGSRARPLEHAKLPARHLRRPNLNLQQ